MCTDMCTQARTLSHMRACTHTTHTHVVPNLVITHIFYSVVRLLAHFFEVFEVEDGGILGRAAIIGVHCAHGKAPRAAAERE